MWSKLPEKSKNTYKKYITNFASLSEVFSQKNEQNIIDGDMSGSVAPVINSKYQETVFQKSFGAVAEDIANTSYDASLILENDEKYLVGIKSFGYHSGDQKVAQFKRSSTVEKWEETLSLIRQNADQSKTKEEADNANKVYYLKLAKRISTLRNARINSSKEQIKGFIATNKQVEAVYHVLMPSKKGEKPQIFIGETDYLPIEIENISILGSTNKNNPTNFHFTDGKKRYKYTSADSQLYMAFDNSDIVVETWNVEYLDDPFMLFESLHLKFIPEDKRTDEGREVISSVSWMIANEDGQVEQNSGYNGFNGASKLARKNNYREKRIERLKKKFKDIIPKNELEPVISLLNRILLENWVSSLAKEEMKELRKKLIDMVEKISNEELILEVEAMVYRPSSEMYIPIPDSRNFHDKNPDFFGQGIGLFKTDSSKLLLPKEYRKFRLEFMASGDSVVAYLNQDSGKGIQSYGTQQILGEWILRGVFQLEPREVLTGARLEEIGINAIRLNKFRDNQLGIGLEFIWVDTESPPIDIVGWASKMAKS